MDISLDNFQGPMDLLLHLIKKKQMNIMDIKLEVIIDEYINYIKTQEKMNLTIASSYLVMASELLEIKSRMLLPSEKNDEEVNELKNNLINRLVEYEKYKEIVPTLKKLEQKRKEYITKSPSNILEYKEDFKISSDCTIDTLIDAYKNFLIRIEEEKPISTKITKKEISMESQILRIKEKFKNKNRISFDELFEERTKPYIVATFLAILEMARFGQIKIYQEDSFKTIMCEKVKEEK